MLLLLEVNPQDLISFFTTGLGRVPHPYFYDVTVDRYSVFPTANFQFFRLPKRNAVYLNTQINPLLLSSHGSFPSRFYPSAPKGVMEEGLNLFLRCTM